MGNNCSSKTATVTEPMDVDTEPQPDAREQQPPQPAATETKQEEKAQEPQPQEAAVPQSLYDTLEATECKSLLKAYLTKEMFDKLKDVKTKQGCDLASCIRSGIDNPDSGIGVYASDSDAYVAFADLLNPIIMDYHKLESLESFQHPTQNFEFDEAFPADLDPENQFILSTRIRVARNIEGYPLRGGMSELQTMELEQKVKDILEGFEDEDLKGTYYPLAGMDEETRQKLVDDHFLFKKGDRFLESAGINQFWPKGRGIFFNTNKTFLVWVNEEDQLRIISMEQGSNIKSVFGRLQKAVAAINEKLEFAYNEKLGYLTACPTNIGCGERASVHIKVPLISQNQQLFDDIAKRNNLQIRGVNGEHSESKGGVFDVSNKRRLGITEWDGVKDLITGCKELIENEMKLQSELKPSANQEATEDAVNEADVSQVEEEADAPADEQKEEPQPQSDESVDGLYTKLDNSDAKSLLKKYLTKEIFDKLKDIKTKQGCDLKSCIQSGIDNPDSGIGVYASDSDAYVAFADLLNPIIMDYHKLESLESFQHPTQNFEFDDTFAVDLDPENQFIISTRVRVARNIEGYPLRGGMSESQTMELEQKVKDILEGFEDEDLKGTYYPLEGMDEETRQKLVDDHFLFKKGDRFLESAGINQFWPKGRGIFFNTNKTFLVWVNEEDQLRIISMEQGANVKSVFGRLQKAVAAINEKLEFAYNDKLGYLTACPTNIGCGERASVHIKVPLTAQNKSELFQDIAQRNNLQIRGINGEHSESEGGVYDVSNKRRLGITEWDGIKDLINGCKELIESETKLRNEM